eukprot:TRINITY_DN1779_c0_g3_i1.p2 TRINITY_DN1779_c0_g3~~TRINITY_DN1779_c0_g3_i1.p2  ORF type:complete len:163 (+),score=41.85 TRINITY_DN1779_c0_g3_i1:31-489(+)
MFLASLLSLFPLIPRYIVPTAGIVISSCTTTVTMTMQRLYDDVRLQRGQVETALALGARPSQACESQVRRSIKRGLAVILDYLKTVGIVQIPSTMTGMFLGGAQPKEAVAAQLLLLVLMVGTSAIVAIVSAFAAAQSLFTKTYQLVDMDFAG